jgi:pyruvate carboxylase
VKKALENVYSPCSGKIEKIFIHDDSYVYEWEKRMVIRTENQKRIEVAVGISGCIVSLEIKKGQHVTHQTLLTKVQDDLLITGSD